MFHYNNMQKKKILFDEILKQWLNSKKNIKIQTYQKYENLIRLNLNNNLGKITISEIKQLDIVNFFEDLTKKCVSISTQKTLFYIINSALKFAYQNKYCKYIDLKIIKFKSSTPKIQVFSREIQQKLEEELKKNLNIRKVCLLLCLYTGLRIGEICGLKWEDIDFDNKSIHIKRTIERIKNANKESTSKTILIESTPKSITSERIIPIPDFLIEYLKKYQNADNFYILSNDETLYDTRQFEAFYARTLKKIGIDHVNFHTLRHTFATRSIEAKMDIKTLSEILGHSSIEITLKLYVHPSYELKKQSIESLVKFMAN